MFQFILNRWDRARGVEIGNKDVELHHLEEAYTSSNWIVTRLSRKRIGCDFLSTTSGECLLRQIQMMKDWTFEVK